MRNCGETVSELWGTVGVAPCKGLRLPFLPAAHVGQGCGGGELVPYPPQPPYLGEVPLDGTGKEAHGCKRPQQPPTGPLAILPPGGHMDMSVPSGPPTPPQPSYPRRPRSVRVPAPPPQPPRAILPPGRCAHPSRPPHSPTTPRSRNVPRGHALSQDALALGLDLHPLPQRVGVIPVHAYLAEHVEFDVVARGELFDLFVTPWLLWRPRCA